MGKLTDLGLSHEQTTRYKLLMEERTVRLASITGVSEETIRKTVSDLSSLSMYGPIDFLDAFLKRASIDEMSFEDIKSLYEQRIIHPGVSLPKE